MLPNNCVGSFVFGLGNIEPTQRIFFTARPLLVEFCYDNGIKLLGIAGYCATLYSYSPSDTFSDVYLHTN